MAKKKQHESTNGFTPKVKKKQSRYKKKPSKREKSNFKEYKGQGK